MAPVDTAFNGYVRVPQSMLAEVHLFHVASAVDAVVGSLDKIEGARSEAITGYTEWAGECDGAQITVGWDWGVVAGEIIVLHPAEIRTNVQVIKDGDPTPVLLTRVYLLEWIETLPWRETAIPDLIRGALTIGQQA